MCRLIAIGRRNGPLTAEDLDAFQHSMIEWGWSNDDGTGIAWVTEDGRMEWVKGGERASDFFKAHGIAERLAGKRVRTLIGHVRLACSGGQCGSGGGTERGAHPFPSCNEDFVLVHNGWINGAEGVVKKVLGDPETNETTGTPRYGRHQFQSGVDSETIVHLIEELGFHKTMERLNDPANKFNVIVLNRDGSVQAHGDGALLGGGIVAPDGEHPDTENPMWMLASDLTPFRYFKTPEGTPMFSSRVVNLTDYDVTVNAEGYSVDATGQPGWIRMVSHHYEPRKKHEATESIKSAPVITAYHEVYGKFCPECRISGVTDQHIASHEKRSKKEDRRSERYGTPDEVLKNGRQTTLNEPTPKLTGKQSFFRTANWSERMGMRYGKDGIFSGSKDKPVIALPAPKQPQRQPSEPWKEFDHAETMKAFWTTRLNNLSANTKHTAEQLLKMEEARRKVDRYGREAVEAIQHMDPSLISEAEMKERTRQAVKKGQELAKGASANSIQDIRKEFKRRGEELRKKQHLPPESDVA